MHVTNSDTPLYAGGTGWGTHTPIRPGQEARGAGVCVPGSRTRTRFLPRSSPEFRMPQTEIELKVIAVHGDGLATALSNVVLANQYQLTRYHRARTDEGLVATLVAKGPAAGLLRLKEQLAAHPLVNRLETANAEAARADSAMRSVVFAAEVSEDDIDRAQAEASLRLIANDYPNVAGHLLFLQEVLEQNSRKATLRHVGQRVGAWVYKRDYQLGGRVSLERAISAIALPALKRLTPVHQEGKVLVTDAAPLGIATAAGSAAARIFLCGLLEGLFEQMEHLGAVRVVEEVGSDGNSRFVVHDLSPI